MKLFSFIILEFLLFYYNLYHFWVSIYQYVLFKHNRQQGSSYSSDSMATQDVNSLGPQQSQETNCDFLRQ